MILLIVGVIWCFLCMALFGSLLSTHSLMATGCFGLGAITKGDTHGVGPDTFSITPMSSRFSSSFSTFGRRWNGTFRCLRAVGLIDLSMCSFIFHPFKQPNPWYSCGYSSSMFATCVSCTCRAKNMSLRSSGCGILTVCLCSFGSREILLLWNGCRSPLLLNCPFHGNGTCSPICAYTSIRRGERRSRW